MKTELCALLGIEYPIFQGGMAWVANASLAGAVSAAGGLGIIAAGNAPADYVRGEIRKVREMTNRPFGVNIMLLSPFVEEIIDLTIEEKVPVVTTGAGMIPAKTMKRWIEAGVKVIPVVPSVAIARMMERNGACAVIAEGGESGGHIGELNTMPLVPQVVDAVNIPVIAAGGIADGRGLAAAMMLGAVGVQMGTRFLVAHECTIHRNYKDRVLRAKDIDTVTTGKSLGHPARALKNPFTRAFAENEANPDMTLEEKEAFGAGALRKAVIDGDEKNGSFMAGECAGMVNREQSCADILAEVTAQAEECLKGAAKWVK